MQSPLADLPEEDRARLAVGGAVKSAEEAQLLAAYLRYLRQVRILLGLPLMTLLFASASALFVDSRVAAISQMILAVVIVVLGQFLHRWMIGRRLKSCSCASWESDSSEA